MSVPAWRWCAVAGVATLSAAVAFGRIPDLAPCGSYSGGAGAMVAFALARDATDVVALFGSEPCASRLIAAQREALWLDMLAFIPAYTLFLLSALAALWRTNWGVAMVAFNLILLAGTMDMLEGAILFRILGEMPGIERSFTGLFWMARPKFALLGLASVALALMLWRGNGLSKIAAGVMAAGGVVSFVYLFKAPHDPVMIRGHMVAWGALLIVAVAGALGRGGTVSR